MDKSTNTTEHYQGESGDKYFDAKFDGRMSLGRQFQAEYILPHCNDDLVLVDFGCGDGTTLRSLPAKRKFGVEINPACHEKIENLNQTANVPINIKTELSQLDAETADLVASNHCLEHVLSLIHI